MINTFSYVITNGEGIMLAYGTCRFSDMSHLTAEAAIKGHTCMFGPDDGTGE